MKTLSLVMAAMILCAGVVVAQDKKGTPADAKTLVEKAITFLKDNGKDFSVGFL